ncbi:MAG: hypothetical protein II757_04565 [Bacteroidales bacterium]|nr:hypothetical protein [Bacteroidales bacterium]MCR5115054.1 hypothetical protein [Bacteroidales bacterium]
MKMKKENLIGACIALVGLLMLTFLPLIKGASLFELFSEGGIFIALGLVWLLFPLLAVVTHAFGKARVLTAFLQLIPVLWGLVYVCYGVAGVGYWIYTALTLVLIVYSLIVKKKLKAQND